MFLLVHASTGLVIGKLIPWPLLSFLVGLISHFILDFIPHNFAPLQKWLNKDNQKIVKNLRPYFIVLVFDLSASALVLAFFYQRFSSLLNLATIAAILGSWLPDFLWPLARIFSFRFFEPLARFHCGIDHWSEKHLSHKIIQNFGFLTQILIMVIILFFFFAYN